MNAHRGFAPAVDLMHHHSTGQGVHFNCDILPLHVFLLQDFPTLGLRSRTCFVLVTQNCIYCSSQPLFMKAIAHRHGHRPCIWMRPSIFAYFNTIAHFPGPYVHNQFKILKIMWE